MLCWSQQCFHDIQMAIVLIYWKLIFECPTKREFVEISPQNRREFFFRGNVAGNLRKNFVILMGLSTFNLDSWNYLRKINTEEINFTYKQYFLLHQTSIKLLFCKATNIIAEIQGGNPDPCKQTCRQAWTNGKALRNGPMGGLDGLPNI